MTVPIMPVQGGGQNIQPQSIPWGPLLGLLGGSTGGAAGQPSSGAGAGMNKGGGTSGAPASNVAALRGLFQSGQPQAQQPQSYGSPYNTPGSQAQMFSQLQQMLAANQQRSAAMFAPNAATMKAGLGAPPPATGGLGAGAYLPGSLGAQAAQAAALNNPPAPAAMPTNQLLPGLQQQTPFGLLGATR